MHQLKLFKNVENDIRQLEDEINEWLRTSRARVVSVFGNIAPQTAVASTASQGLTRSQFAPSDVMVAILYEEP